MKVRYLGCLIAAAGVLLCLGFVLGYGFAAMPAHTAEVSPGDEPDPLMVLTANELVTVLEGKLLTASSGIRTHAASLNGYTDDPSKIYPALQDLYAKNPLADSVVLVNTEGIIVDAVPDYSSIIGQPDGLHLNASSFPPYSSHMSGYRTFTGGGDGVSYSYPVYTEDSVYAGYLSLNLDTKRLFSQFSADLSKSTPYDVWVCTSDGTVLYDADTFEIGKNLLTDPLYMTPSLRAAFEEMLSHPDSGHTQYTFYDVGWTKDALVNVVWKSTDFWNDEHWIVVVSTAVPVENTYQRPITPENVAMEHLVRQAVLYAREHGKEAALAEFNNISGQFTQGNFYIYAYDRNGTVLALPYQPELLGINRSTMEDRVGVKYNQQSASRAAQGGGYLYIRYPNPADSYAEQMKLLYLLPVDETWYVGTGMYLPNASGTVNWGMRDEMIQQVRSLQDYANTHGMNATLAVMNNPEGMFAVPGLGLFAETTQGDILANPLAPQQVGTNILGMTNEYGMSLARDIISLANRGGGFAYSSFKENASAPERLNLVYVQPIDDEWFVGSSMPLTP